MIIRTCEERLKSVGLCVVAIDVVTRSECCVWQAQLVMFIMNLDFGLIKENNDWSKIYVTEHHGFISTIILHLKNISSFQQNDNVSNRP